MASIYDVAKEAGVSTSTVSRTFRTPNLLKRETEQKVLDAAQRLNYHPHRARTSVKPVAAVAESIEDYNLGLIFVSLYGDTLTSNEFYGPLFSATAHEASELGMNLVVNTTSPSRILAEPPKIVRDRSVDGLVLTGTVDIDTINLFKDWEAPLIVVDNPDPTGRHDNIVTNGFTGTYDATDYLLGLGHSRIGFITTVNSHQSFKDRFRGYLAACYDRGCPVDPENVVSVRPGANDFDQITEYLKRPGRPTAIVACNDVNARNVMTVRRTLGIDIPGDLSIIGFDDIDMSKSLHPPLTTVAVDKELIGRVAIRRLRSRLRDIGAGIEPEPPLTILVRSNLVVRASCRAL